MTSAAFPNLEGLDGLSRQSGVDTRPTLVRVLTDLYLQKPEHTPDEARHYTELVMRLLDDVDMPTRTIVARKLARYSAAPLAVIRRLAHDAFEVAEPVLKHAEGLTGADLIAIIRQHDARYAAAIASRRNQANADVEPAAPAEPEPAAQQPAAQPPPAQQAVAVTLPAQSRDISALESLRRTALPLRGTIRTMASPATTAETPVAAPVLAAPEASAPAQPEPENRIGEEFLKANSTERRALLTRLDNAPMVDAAALAMAAQDDAIRRLETAALQRRSDVFIRELEHALGMSNEHASQIVQDETGEPLLVCARAMAMPSNILLRILLFLNPMIGNSVRHVFDLAQLYDRMTTRAARQITASLRVDAPEPARSRPAMHRPLLWNDDQDAGRRAAGDAARRQLGAPTSGSAPRRESLASLLAGRRKSS